MKDFGIVHGMAEQAVPLVVGTDTVYVHTEINPITTGTNGEPITNQFSYREVQYSKDEYIHLMADQNSGLETQVTDLQVAMVELFEGMV